MSGGARLRATAGGSVTMVADDTLTTDEVQVFPVVVAGVGVNQTWQDMSASRAGNVTYTNTTAKPIMVSAFFNAAVSANVTMVVGSVVVSTNSVSLGDGMSFITIVPSGSTYKINTTQAVVYWSELREVV